jgi:putative transposase
MTVLRNVRVVTQEQAAGVADLPAEVSLALTDIVAVAREGLLAMSVAAGMAVMQIMFEAEITAVAGAKGKHNPTGGRCGTAPGRDR